jgi:phosphate transport system substrate-binding protein
MRRTAAMVAALLCAGCGPSGELSTTRYVVQIDGSSTVFPITEAMGEQFQKETQTRVSIGVSGTGGGFKKFCRGEIDIAAASRPIKDSEAADCAASGLEFIELPVALDALAVVVHPQNAWARCLTVEELRTAWRAEAEGRVRSWADLNPAYPDEPLSLYGPGVDSGTFDYFTEVVNGKAGASRADYNASEDDNITIQGVSGDRGGLGYLGIAYANEVQDKVRLVPIRQADGACVPPTVETARSGAYKPFTRPLFFYVSKAAAERKPHVRNFIAFVFDAAQEPLVSEVGYVALPEAQYAAARERFARLQTGAAAPHAE